MERRLSALSRAKVDATLERVRVHYMPRQTAKMLNSIADSDGPRMFCGWYWFFENEEAGPFKSWSAAIDNAHTKIVARRNRPAVAHAFAPQPKPKRERKWTPQLIQHAA
ncbi:MAG: hypothetical protein JWP57_4404 [Spirosoma sp.]|nr:hypothetical protein [Spirosoma sp.]